MKTNPERLSEYFPAPPPGLGGWYPRWGKRSLDLFLSLPALVLLLPLLLVVAVLVECLLGKPIIFRQERPGLGGRNFELFKFRTMTDARNGSGEVLPDSARLTPFGRLLRASSLDELPELINVFRGDMSLVGPRPLLVRYYPWFTRAERVRFLVPPGITGLAQIYGRNDISWNERIAYDVEYAQRCSFGLDIRILCITVLRVISRQGFRPDPGAVMLNFDEERRQSGHQPSAPPTCDS